MADVRPFAALRPKPAFAAQVSALPYDVMSSDEARELVKNNPYSFLHVTKAEIDLDPGVSIYDDLVYETAALNLGRMEAYGILERDKKPCYYIYAQSMDGRTQTGVVAVASVDEYLSGRIKKHELTREEKELDRVKHVTATRANTGPVFLTHKPCPKISAFISDWTTENEALYQFMAEDGVTHTAWIVDNESAIDELRDYFDALDVLYIADGHHRNASAARVSLDKRAQNPDADADASFNYYLSVIFSSDELYIMDYNRVVESLNEHSPASFKHALMSKFDIKSSPQAVYPHERHSFGMYLDDGWYVLKAKPGIIIKGDAVAALDVSILQTHVLEPLLGIKDPRTDRRIDFVGGLRGLRALEDHVKLHGGVAFSMHPTSMEELMSIADKGQIMPPKSTWFEPKLRSGLFVHTFR